MRRDTNAGSLKKEKAVEARWCYLFLALPIIGYVLFQVYPILWTMRWSFYSYSGVESTARWVGMRNFISFFTTDMTYWHAWGNTLKFALCKVPIELTLALGLAMLLQDGRKGAGIFRSLYYLPNVVSVAIIGVVFSNLFSYFGVINVFLQKIGLIKEGIDWFANKNYAMGVVVAGSIWNTFGINVMYFMAALSGVPADLYESADLDGASSWTKFVHITLPMIVKMGQIILLMSVVGTLSTNDYIVAMTNGGPAGGTNTVMSYMTTKFVPGFADTTTPAIGYGCSMGLVTTLLFMLIAVGYNKLNKKLSNIY